MDNLLIVTTIFLIVSNNRHVVFSGTGKTATFSISILQQIDTTLNECQALILAPTRELAQQIQKVRSNFPK